MKQICALIGLFIALTTLSLEAQQEQIKKRAVLLNVGAGTSGFTFSYEQYLFHWNKKAPTFLNAFVGYGFNSSNWIGQDTRPNQFPRRATYRSDYYPRRKHKDGRHRYYLGDLDQYTVGLEFCQRLGRRKHFYEIACGIALDYYNRKVNFFPAQIDFVPEPSYERLTKADAWNWGTHSSIRIGYRFVGNNGLTLGAGLSVIHTQGLATQFYATHERATPYLSLGYSF